MRYPQPGPDAAVQEGRAVLRGSDGHVSELYVLFCARWAVWGGGGEGRDGTWVMLGRGNDAHRCMQLRAACIYLQRIMHKEAAEQILSDVQDCQISIPPPPPPTAILCPCCVYVVLQFFVMTVSCRYRDYLYDAYGDQDNIPLARSVLPPTPSFTIGLTPNQRNYALPACSVTTTQT